ncbi:MAG TPA: type IV pilin N-terminal domain-containing protein [Candidatus Thermoplasmatota archaeon]|nr:type IV pilin N-terminal domain-containing protein [Candidatus Thermoplasmatota archaeon]
MPANTRNRRGDEAVSPVIGTILMVAITVVLAAVVLVLVNGTNGNGDSAPPVAMQRDEASDQVEVVRGSGDADWSLVEIRSSEALRFALNGAAGIASTQLPAGTFVAASASSNVIDAAEFLDFCGDGAIKSNVDITLRYTSPNSVLEELHYLAIPACL